MLILICAAGSQHRWEASGGEGLKQLIEIDGETLIDRLYRQVTGRGFTDVVTLVTDPDLECWQGVNPQKPAHEDWMGEMGKFLDGRPYWPEEGEVCVLYGDAYYTDECLDRILDHEPDQPTVYGRANAPGRQSESFGFRFRVPEHVEEVVRICRVLARAGKNTKGGPWRWFFYRHTGRKGVRKGADRARLSALATEENGWVECGHDATDDFDKLADFHGWTRNESHAAAYLPASTKGTDMTFSVADRTLTVVDPRGLEIRLVKGRPIPSHLREAYNAAVATAAVQPERRAPVPPATTSVRSLKRPALLRAAKAAGIPAKGTNAELIAALEAQA